MKHLIIVVVLFASMSVNGAVTMEAFPLITPNGFTDRNGQFYSKNWEQYRDNALTAIIREVTTYSAGSAPANYTKLSNNTSLSYKDIISTDFPSWKGVAFPQSPYNQEFGNRLGIGIHIKGNGVKFTINQLSYSGSGFPNNMSNWNWNKGDFTFDNLMFMGVSNGQATFNPDDQLDELVGIGAYYTIPIYDNNSGILYQTKIDNYSSKYNLTNDVIYTGTYTLDGVRSVSTSVKFSQTTPAPEPTIIYSLLIPLLLRTKR